METNEINEMPGPAAELSVTELAQSYLLQVAKWGKFLSIVGFVGAGLMALVGVFFGTFMTAVSRFQPGSGAFTGAMGGFFGFFYILIAIFYFIASRYLYQFSDRTKTSLLFKDSLQLETGFEKLKSLFKMVGITTVVFLVLYALIIIGVIVAAVVGASMMKSGY